MVKEIELKFLIKDLPIVGRPYDAIIDIIQYYYIDNGIDFILRCKQCTDKIEYIKMRKIKIGYAESEVYTDILTREQYQEILKKIIDDENTTFIHKIRYVYKTNNHILEFDIFDFKLAIMEVEIKSLDDDNICADLNIDIIAEITDNELFSNKNLSKKIK